MRRLQTAREARRGGSPQGLPLQSAEVSGEKAEIANQAETATVRVVPTATKTVEWNMVFAR